MRSEGTNDLLQPISDFSKGMNMARITHQMTAGAFYPVTFDSLNHVYYRIHGAKTEDIDTLTNFYLIVFDEKNEKKLELRFPEGYYIFPILSREGLMFMAFNKHDDKIELIRYNFGK